MIGVLRQDGQILNDTAFEARVTEFKFRSNVEFISVLLSYSSSYHICLDYTIMRYVNVKTIKLEITLES
jgi:hypothetical protein